MPSDRLWLRDVLLFEALRRATTYYACFGLIRWDESVILTFFPVSVLFGRVTSGLKLEVSLLGRINQGGFFLLRFKT